MNTRVSNLFNFGSHSTLCDGFLLRVNGGSKLNAEFNLTEYKAANDIATQVKFHSSNSIDLDVAVLNDVTIFPGRSVASNGSYALESFSQMHLNRNLSIEEEVSLGCDASVIHNHCNPEKLSDGDVILLKENIYSIAASCFMNNFGHWHIETLASLSLIDRLSVNVKFIFPTLAKWQRDILLLSGLSADRILEFPAKSKIIVTNLLYPSPSWVYKADIYKVPNVLHDRILSIKGNVLRAHSFGIIDKIYVSRPIDKNRPLNNQDQVEQLLCSKFGFVSIRPETLSYQEQVFLFSNASVIAGTSGAAFTSLAFCKENVKLFEFSYSRGWYQAWHKWARNFTDLTHYVYVESDANIQYHPLGLDGVPSIKSWVIDLGKLEKFLQVFL